MQFTLPLLFTLLSGALAAISIPRGTTGVAINISKSELRIYHQVDTSLGIKEISVGLPTAAPTNDGFIYGGATRAKTPLAAITWTDDGQTNPEIRVYFITSRNTLGEVAYTSKGWNGGGDIGFPIAVDSTLLYGLKVGSVLIVGYTNAEGNLAEAYYDIASPGWKTYTL